MSELIHKTINNQIVAALRQGSSESVSALLNFGVNPYSNIDLVMPGGGANSGVTTRSAWFWSHQGKQSSGVLAWWDWLDRNIEAQPTTQRAQLLAKMFIEAIDASAPQEDGDTIVATWGRALSWADDNRAPGWSRQIMMSYLASSCSRLGNPSAKGLHKLELESLISKADWSNEARQKYAQDPLTVAVSKVQVDLVELLLDMGCSPTTQDGKPIIAEAWCAFSATSARADFNMLNENDESALLMERLLARGLDWDVYAHPDKKRTVAQEAEDWLGMLKSDPHRWEGVSRQIEARILGQKTAPSPRANRAPSKRRL